MRNLQEKVPLGKRGLTLIEITLVISVLLGLVTVLFIGVSAYKEGANRALCIQNISRVQTAMRVFCNYQELIPGQDYPNLKEQVISPGSYIEDEPVCPGSGSYSYYEDRIPPTGVLFLNCSEPDHVPSTSSGW